MMLMMLRLYWKPVGQVSAPRPPVPIFLTWTSATLGVVAEPLSDVGAAALVAWGLRQQEERENPTLISLAGCLVEGGFG
jgi:hypothetical protein